MIIMITLMTQSFGNDRSGQTVLLEEQSDQGLHCFLFHLHHFDKIRYLKIWPLCLNLR